MESAKFRGKLYFLPQVKQWKVKVEEISPESLQWEIENGYQLPVYETHGEAILAACEAKPNAMADFQSGRYSKVEYCDILKETSYQTNA